MKPGTRLKSAVCDSEVMVIRFGDGQIECGGAAMAEGESAGGGEIAASFSGGTQMGKRYVDTDGTLELLCVKPGAGSLSLDGVALTTKEAKSLPSSD